MHDSCISNYINNQQKSTSTLNAIYSIIIPYFYD